MRSKHPSCVSSPSGGWIMWASDSRKTTELFSPHYSGAGCLEGSLKSNGFLYPRRKLWPAKLVTRWLTETSRKIPKIHLAVTFEKEQNISNLSFYKQRYVPQETPSKCVLMSPQVQSWWAPPLRSVETAMPTWTWMEMILWSTDERSILCDEHMNITD